MQRVNQHSRPSIIQVGCPTCCYQVCALDHANVGTADLDYSSGSCHRNAMMIKLALKWVSFQCSGMSIFFNLFCKHDFVAFREPMFTRIKILLICFAWVLNTNGWRLSCKYWQFHRNKNRMETVMVIQCKWWIMSNDIHQFDPGCEFYFCEETCFIQDALLYLKSGPPSKTWINFNSSMDKYSHAL